MSALFGRFAATIFCLAVLAATTPPVAALEPGKQVTVVTLNGSRISIPTNEVFYVELADGRLGVAWTETDFRVAEERIQFRAVNLKSGRLSPILTVYRDKLTDKQPTPAKLIGARLLSNKELQVLFTDGDRKSGFSTDINLFERRIKGNQLASPKRKLRSIPSSDVFAQPFAVKRLDDRTLLIERADASDGREPFAFDVTLFQTNGGLAKTSRRLTAAAGSTDPNLVAVVKNGLDIALIYAGQKDPAGGAPILGSVISVIRLAAEVTDVVVFAPPAITNCLAFVPSGGGFHALFSQNGVGGVTGQSFTDALVPDDGLFSLDVFNVSDACNVLPSENDGFLLAHEDERRDGLVVFEFGSVFTGFARRDRVFIRHPATRRQQTVKANIALELTNGDIVVDQRVSPSGFTDEQKIVFTLIDRE